MTLRISGVACPANRSAAGRFNEAAAMTLRISPKLALVGIGNYSLQ